MTYYIEEARGYDYDLQMKAARHHARGYTDGRKNNPIDPKYALSSHYLRGHKSGTKTRKDLHSNINFQKGFEDHQAGRKWNARARGIDHPTKRGEYGMGYEHSMKGGTLRTIKHKNPLGFKAWVHRKRIEDFEA